MMMMMVMMMLRLFRPLDKYTALSTSSSFWVRNSSAFPSQNVITNPMPRIHACNIPGYYLQKKKDMGQAGGLWLLTAEARVQSRVIFI
jgi:hypothetical protein